MIDCLTSGARDYVKVDQVHEGLFMLGKRWRVTAGMLLLACGAVGCQSVGALIYSTYGALPIEAQYKLGDRPTLIIVEDAAHFGLNELDADVVAKNLAEELNENKAATLVNSDKLLRLRDTDAAKYRSMTISDLARLTGASQVLYVDLQNSTAGVESTGAAAQAKAIARVRVVDAGSGTNAWPPDERLGHPITAELRFDQVDETRLIEQHAILLGKLSTSIGELFYSYQPDDDSPGHESQFDSDNQLDVKKDL